MLLLIHIIIALASILVTTLAFFFPTQAKLRTSYSFVGATVITGSALIYLNSEHLIQSCISGLAYIAMAFIGIAATKRKLRAAELSHNKYV